MGKKWMELWDAYDKQGRKMAIELTRGKPIPVGLYHLVSEMLVRHVDGEYLLMQRDYQKDGYPGWMEATAGESALKGEDSLEAAKRELWEETGLTGISFQEIGRCSTENTIFVSYLVITDCDKESVKLQRGETIGYRWISEEEFMRFLTSPLAIPTQRERLARYFLRSDP